MNIQKIILASKSPYRKQLLQRLGIDFECIDSNLDESILKGLIADPTELTVELSKAKAKNIANNYSQNALPIIIGSDQVGHFNGEILGKTGSIEGSTEQLLKLQGNTHELITSYAIMHSDGVLINTVKTELKMRNLSLNQIKNYLSHDNPIDCAGSYKLELKGISLFENINTSDYTAIIGLPLMELANDLNRIGVVVPPAL